MGASRRGCDLPRPRLHAEAAQTALGLRHSHPCIADQQPGFDAEAEEFPFSWDLGMEVASLTVK